MTQRQDIGMQAVHEIYTLWGVDADRVIWYDNGFDWWPGDYRVALRVSDQEDFHGDPGYRLWMATDFLTGASVETNTFKEGLDIVRRFTPSYAIRVIPEDFAKEYPGDSDSNVDFVSTAYLHEGVQGWLPRFFSAMALMQPIDAQTRADGFGELLGGRPNHSIPENKTGRLALDEMLGVAEQLYVPAGESESQWSGSSEFEEFIDQYGNSEMCFGNAGPTGMTLETPFGGDSALVRLHTDEAHPQLGNGLLVTLKIPYFPGKEEAINTASWYNFQESITFTGFPLLGSWSAASTRGDTVGPAYSSFIPNALYQPGIATNVALWTISRARWVRETFWPELEDLPMTDILNKRFNA